MAGSASGTGVAGSSFTHYGYPAAPYTTWDFHYCNNGHGNNIVNYNNATEVQTCQLVSLAE